MAFRVSFGKPPAEAAPSVHFRPAGNDERSRNINLLKARRFGAFEIATNLFHQVASLGAANVQVDRTSAGSTITVEVDGITHALPALDLATATALVSSFKQLAGITAQEVRWRQSGQFTAIIKNKSWECTVVSSGIPSGERTQLLLDAGKAEFANLAAASVSEPLQKRMRASLAAESGLLLFSAPPQSGMTELLETAVRDSDRFQRSYYLLENSRRPRPDIENVATRKFDGSTVTIDSLLRSIAKEHPDVLIVPEIDDAEIVDSLTSQPAQGRLAIGGVLANDAPETLLRVLATRCNARRFAGEVTAVANARLLRKLCVTCRQPYLPSPQMVMELNLAIGETQALFRPSGTIPGERDEPMTCPACGGLGYRGRAAVIQWMEVSDEMRATMLGSSDDHLQLLREQAAAAGMTPHLAEAATLAAAGITSVEEIVRVLRTPRD